MHVWPQLLGRVCSKYIIYVSARAERTAEHSAWRESASSVPALATRPDFRLNAQHFSRFSVATYRVCCSNPFLSRIRVMLLNGRSSLSANFWIASRSCFEIRKPIETSWSMRRILATLFNNCQVLLLSPSYCAFLHVSQCFVSCVMSTVKPRVSKFSRTCTSAN